MLRKVSLVIATVCIIVAVVLAVSGGFRTTVGGLRISARSPLAATIAALIAGAAWLALARRERSVAADLEAGWRALERHATRAIGGIALIAAIVAASFATRSAAGADASGYLSQAQFLASGSFYYADLLLPYSEHPWLTTPLGWVPGPAGYQAPSYPPGLPLLFAVPHAVAGVDGAVAVVTAAAALAVWATGMIAGGVAGILAAVLIAFSPVFLHQSFQPMSDVPVTAAWLLCFLLLRGDKPSTTFLAGLACGVAVLIRPNLAPLAIVPFVVARNRISFAIPVMLAGIFLAAVWFVWYGSPLRSGYGSAGDLFSFANAGANVGRYFSWLLATAPVLLIAPLGFSRVRSNRRARALVGFAVLVIGAYLLYAVFDHWSYLRFLLPALAVFAVFASVELTAWIDASPVSWRLPLFVLVAVGLAAHGLSVARSLESFTLADQVRRVEQVASFINDQVPRDAAILSGEQSGSMRYYTGRPILRWDAATPDTLGAALDHLRASQRPVYIVLDAFEHESFVKKFATRPELALDWPPMVDAGASHRTRLWRLADRDRFLSGENLQTLRVP